jgi:Domain of unknown function (DUF4926)
MRLPPGATIAREKLSGYLLVHQARGDKSVFLARAGYKLENADQLLEDLRVQVLSFDSFRRLLPNSRPAYRPKWRDAECSLHLDAREVVRRNEIHYLNPGEIRTVRFELYTDVALTRDIPEHRLRRGDVVKIVDHHPSPTGENGYSIEVFNAIGDTIAVTAVPESALESLHKGEVLSVRALAAK